MYSVYIDVFRLFFSILHCINNLAAFTHLSEKSIYVFYIALSPLCGIILDWFHQYFKVAFSIDEFMLTTFLSFELNILKRIVIDNVQVASNNVAGCIILKWGVSTGATMRLRLEVVNFDILSRLFVIENFSFYWLDICIRVDRYRLIFKEWRFFRVIYYWWRILPRLMASRPSLT